MTKDEAIFAAKRGEKVTHKTFSDGEWFGFSSGKMYFEDGMRCSEEEFWHYRSSEIWDCGYAIFSELKVEGGTYGERSDDQLKKNG